MTKENQMVERVARAICRDRFLASDAEDDGWAAACEQLREDYRGQARAAIEAMRELPQPILDLMTPEGIPSPRFYQTELKQSWAFMIDAALQNPEPK